MDCPIDHFLVADGLPHSGSDVSELLSRPGRAAGDPMVKVARDSRLARIDALRNFLVRHYMLGWNRQGERNLRYLK